MGSVRSLVGAGSAVGFARVFSLLCAAIQLPLLTRVLSTSEFAQVSLAIAIATYFSLLSADPVILGFQRHPGRNDNRANYAFARTRTLIILTIAALVVVGAGFFFGYQKEAIAFAGWGIGISINRIISAAWLMWGRPWQYAWNLLAGTGTRTFILLLLVLTGCDPLLSLGAAGAASAAAALVLSPRLHCRQLNRAPRPWPVRFGLNLAIASLAYAALSNGSLLLLSSFTTSGVVGQYAAMSQVAALTSGAVSGLLFTMSYPRLRLAWDKGHSALVRTDLTTLQLAYLSIALLSVFFLYVGDFWLLKFVIPEGFIDGKVLAPLILATGFAAMGEMGSWHHQFGLAAARVALNTVIAAVLGLVITIGLAAVFQEQGAAFGVALGFLVYFALMRSKTHPSSMTFSLAVAALVLVGGITQVPSLSNDAVAYAALAAGGIALGLGMRRVRARIRMA